MSIPSSLQSQSPSKDNKNGIDESTAAAAAVDDVNGEYTKMNVNTNLGCDSVKDVPNLDSIKLEDSCNVKGGHVNNTTSSNKILNEKSKKESERTYCF